MNTEMAAYIAAPLPGQLAPVVDLQAGAARLLLVDCTPLLRQFELVARVERAESANAELVGIGRARALAGTVVELQLLGLAGGDAMVSVAAVTSQGRVGFSVQAHVCGAVVAAAAPAGPVGAAVGGARPLNLQTVRR
jgi:hypothetical protein